MIYIGRGTNTCVLSLNYDIIMISGSKGHAFHAGMKRHEFETRKTRESSPSRADFECFRVLSASGTRLAPTEAERRCGSTFVRNNP